MNPIIEIRGSPGPLEAAAVAAVIADAEDAEAAERAQPTTAPRQSAWVVSWRPREVHAPLPSHVFDAEPWTPIEEDPIS